MSPTKETVAIVFSLCFFLSYGTVASVKLYLPEPLMPCVLLRQSHG